MFLPINQVRLTNVAIVRITKGGKRFEIACYRNKVVNYRQGIETDLSEVMQTDRVFTNVSKGEFAKTKDLHSVFGNGMSEEDISLLILKSGDLQVSDLERTQQYENMARDIATWISDHGVHPVTQRPYTIPQIRQAMKQCEYTTHPTRSMKKQYLDCFKKMTAVIPMVRAKMQLQLVYPQSDDATVKTRLEENSIVTTDEMFVVTAADMVTATLLVDPSLYRVLEDLSKKVGKGGRLEILKQVVMREGDSNLEEEMRENQQQQDQNDASTAAAAAAMDQVTQRLADTTLARSNDAPTAPAVDDDDNGNDDHDHYQNAAPAGRKNQKKAQKKSKKAKRREKEEAEERQERIDAEEKRRSDRASTMPTSTASTTTVDGDTTATATTKACNTCGGAFASMPDYRAHFRSDWHRYNVKLKLKGANVVSEQEFVLCDDGFFDNM